MRSVGLLNVTALRDAHQLSHSTFLRKIAGTWPVLGNVVRMALELLARMYS